MARGDLLILALPVTPLRDGEPPRGLGVKWHGLLFGLARSGDPSVSGGLHDLARKPFTVAPLLDAPRGRPVRRVRAGERYWLQTSVFDVWLPEVLSRDVRPRWLLDWWLRELVERLPNRLPMRTGGESSWDYLLDLDAEAWMQAGSFAALSASDDPSPRQRIEFCSPTTFGLPLPQWARDYAPDLSSPLPDPEFILRNLAATWREWAPPEVREIASPELVDGLTPFVELAACEIRAERIELGPHERLPAFTGWAVLEYRPGRGDSPEQTQDRLRLFSALLGLANYTGIGIKTARGMGLVRTEPC